MFTHEACVEHKKPSDFRIGRHFAWKRLGRSKEIFPGTSQFLKFLAVDRPLSADAASILQYGILSFPFTTL
jgi:hypothetical protein